MKTILDRRGAHSTRIENRSGGGIPDVHIVLAGKAFWLELKSQVKMCKPELVKIYNFLSANQKAWHASYSAAGGRSYILLRTEVQGPRSKITDKNSAMTDDIGAIFGEPGPRTKAREPRTSGPASAITDGTSADADVITSAPESGSGVITKSGRVGSGTKGRGPGAGSGRGHQHRHWYTVGSGRGVGSGEVGSGIIYEGPDLGAALDAIMDDLP